MTKSGPKPKKQTTHTNNTMPVAVALTGPQRWLRKEKRYVPYRTPVAISSGSLTCNNIQHNLQGNKITLHQTDKPDTLFLYHSYTYTFNGQEMGGRWYNTLFSLNTLRNISTDNNTLRVDLDNYENDDDNTLMGPASIVIVFSPKGIRAIAKYMAGLTVVPTSALDT
jgi:hypothetical protein